MQDQKKGLRLQVAGGQSRMSSIFKSGTTPLRVGIYHRIGHPDALAVYSSELIEEQWRRETEQQENMIIADYYFDDSPVGAEASPERNRLLADCRAGKIDIVMVRKMKYLNPDSRLLLKIITELSSLEPPVDVYFTTEQVHSTGSEGAILMKLLKDGGAA